MKILITGGSGFIGTNLIHTLLNHENDIKNIDIVSPCYREYLNNWCKCDIMEKVVLKEAIYDFQPEIVIHLAARVDIHGKKLNDYKTNTIGTENLLNAVESLRSVRKVIITSTQFVHQKNGIPLNDDDYAPHTVYGASKVEMEKIVKNYNLPHCWTIIRPTNIWGPWHSRYPFEFWKVLAEGRYLHPKNQKVIRSYGYVGNVCWQIKRLIEIDEAIINKQVFYVGDKPINIIDWVNEFSKQQIGKKVKQVDLKILVMIAIIGDMLKIFKIKFPLTSSRLTSMTTSNEAPITKTFELLGKPPYSLEEGVKVTIDWLKEYYPNLVKI